MLCSLYAATHFTHAHNAQGVTHAQQVDPLLDDIFCRAMASEDEEYDDGDVRRNKRAEGIFARLSF